MGLGLLPRAVRGLLCGRHELLDYHISSQRAEAERRIARLEPGTPVLFLKIHRSRARRLKVEWPRRLEVEP